MSLLTGSPAIGAGNVTLTPPLTLPTTDQRGLPRTAGGKLDIGAIQTQPPSIAFTTLGETTVAGQPTGAISIELQDPDGNPASNGIVTYSGNGTTADTTGSTNLTLVNVPAMQPVKLDRPSASTASINMPSRRTWPACSRTTTRTSR